eukprot:4888611-Prorocentrum_lima.AAC.1
MHAHPFAKLTYLPDLVHVTVKATAAAPDALRRTSALTSPNATDAMGSAPPYTASSDCFPATPPSTQPNRPRPYCAHAVVCPPALYATTLPRAANFVWPPLANPKVARSQSLASPFHVSNQKE